MDLAARYAAEGADELVFYDIGASPAGKTVPLGWVRKVREILDIPFTVAGGIRSVEDARVRLENGADKISINSPALENPALIDDLIRDFGTQCVVVGIDSLRTAAGYEVFKLTGSDKTRRPAGRATSEWVTEVIDRGAGEIVLNCMDQDGVRSGYDIPQLMEVREKCSVPLIASGGAGQLEHFLEVFDKADADGALAASVFHKGLFSIGAVKDYLQAKDIKMRLS